MGIREIRLWGGWAILLSCGAACGGDDEPGGPVGGTTGGAAGAAGQGGVAGGVAGQPGSGGNVGGSGGGAGVAGAGATGAGGVAGSSGSNGCGQGTLAAGNQVHSFDHDGRSREARIHIPPGYDGVTPMPLVLNFHGFGSDMGQQELFSGMNATADAEGFVVAYPNGIASSWHAGEFCCGTALTDNVDDVGFSRALVAEISRMGCIDSRRVFTTGMSNGGFMSHYLACQAADLFAAVGAVAGGVATMTCQPSREIPIIHFHGTADTIVPYDNVPALMDLWAGRNGCTGQPVETYRQGQAHCDTWQTCAGNVEQTLCTIDGMGHCWPGKPCFGLGTENRTDLDANQATWEFFQRFSLP